MTVTERFFGSFDLLIETLSTEIAAELDAGVVANGAASLVCAGGTTPFPLYEALSKAPIGWDKVGITLSDERWADTDSPASNEGGLRKRLLVNAAAPARLVPFMTAHATPQEAEAEVGAAVATLALPFDVVVLGMGTDGHTASLYPNAPGLQAALDVSDPALVRGVMAVGAQGSENRMTLSLRGLLNARKIRIVVKGQDKLEAYRWAQSEGPVEEAPVRAILRQTETPVEFCWAP